MEMLEDGKQKECFGILKRVFPKGKDGLREVSLECSDCTQKVACLKKAVSTEEGIAMQEEILEGRAAYGLRGVLWRWSRKKTLSRLRKEEKEKSK
jgi:hypothetical protein